MSSVSESYEALIERYEKEFPGGTPFVCACEKGRVEDVEAMTLEKNNAEDIKMFQRV